MTRENSTGLYRALSVLHAYTDALDSQIDEIAEMPNIAGRCCLAIPSYEIAKTLQGHNRGVSGRE